MQQPLRPPGQRVAKRNARKEKLVKCVLATRCRRHPRRGNQLSSLCGTPPRPSYSPRKPAGTLSRRPSHSNFARMCKVATKAVFSFGPCTARFLFHKMEKKMGGCIPAGQAPLREQTPPWPPFGGPSAPYTAERQAAPVQPARHPTARYSLIFLYNTQILSNIIQTVFVFGV